MAEHTLLLPVLKALSDAPKRQQMTTLQCAFDDTTRQLRFYKHIVATPSLLKTTLALCFCLNHRDDLGMVFHQFFIREHTSNIRKALKSRVNQH